MPVYEYRCKDCSHEFDRHQSFTDARLTDCPACETAGSLRKVFGNIGVTFKGSGFYRTDSRSTGSSSLSSNGSQNGADQGSSSGETKPASDSQAASGSKSESKTTTSESSAA